MLNPCVTGKRENGREREGETVPSLSSADHFNELLHIFNELL